jgi:hypothetical protein
MTKHTSGKHGRTIGRTDRKAGWPSPATAWCYICGGTHRWEQGCAARGSQRAVVEHPDEQGEHEAVAARG